MNKSIFITNGQQAFNQLIATRMLSIGHRVVLHVEDSEQGISYVRSLESEIAQRLHIVNGMPSEEKEYEAMMEEAISVMGGLDVMIHGNELLDEERLFEDMPDEFGERIPALFERIFLWNKMAVSHMIKRKSGKIVFPIIYDTLYYDQYPSSPIINHGKISMMKCLSRECSAFRIDVNVMTFGYHDADFEKSEKRKTAEAGNIRIEASDEADERNVGDARFHHPRAKQLDRRSKFRNRHRSGNESVR